MVNEGNGWPLGLGNINCRIMDAGGSSDHRSPQMAAVRQRCTSFSSFSSSNLDTESTSSFFRDQSVLLGRLIGIKMVNKGNNNVNVMYHLKISNSSTQYSEGLCVPMLHHVRRMGRSRRQ